MRSSKEHRSDRAWQVLKDSDRAVNPKTRCALNDLPPGACGVVRELHGGAYLISTLAAMGVTIGTELCVVRNSAHAPLLIAVYDTRLAVGRSEANLIEVELIVIGDERETDR
jgi:Fe2+ transport system protein FeoA